MRKRALKIWCTVGGILATVFAMVVIGTSCLKASAISDADLTKKTLLNALRTCYASAYMSDGPINGSTFIAEGIDTLLTDAGKNDRVVLVPTQVGNTIVDSQISCKEVFSGENNKKRGKISGLLSLFNKKTDNITYFGYTLSDTNPGNNQQGCISIQYADSSNKTQTTDSVCFKLENEKFVNPYGENIIVKKNGSGGPVTLFYDSSLGALNLSVDGATQPWNPQTIAYTGTQGVTWSSFVGEAENSLKNGPEWNGCTADDPCRPIDDAWNWVNGDAIGLGYSYKSVVQSVSGGEVYEEYVKQNQDAASLRGLRYIAGANANWQNEEIVKFTKDDAYKLYETYFQRFKNEQKVYVDSDCYSKEEKSKATAGSGYAVYSGNGKWCGVRINTTTDSTEKYNVVNDSFDGLYAATIEQILEKMTEWEFSYVEDPENPPMPGEVTPDPDNDGGDVDLDDCTGAAGSLGWVLCPVLKMVANAVDEIYNGYVQDQFLQVDSTKVQTGTPVYESWSAIREIANIIFVIFFLVVLLSQLTGIGISNYGVKKMLPRLIMVAVLVNISFLLCQFAVDLSNVLGYGLNNLFSSMSSKIGGGANDLGGFSTGSSTIATWGGIIGAAVGAATIGSWLIPLLLVMLSCAISVFFGAIVLAARQAGIYILIVLAPVAIVCYALPNAKKMFDRWFKMFTALLLVFPICGALMGGGLFASNILLTPGSGFFITLVAMLLRVVPFFMIPALVKSSMSAMGNLGAKIANVGNRVGRTATGSVAKSDFVKRRDADISRLQGNATAWRGRMLNRITGKAGEPLSDRRRAKIARQYAKYNKLRSEEAAANPFAMSPGSREYEALKNAAKQNRIDTLAKNIVTENTGIATNNIALQEAHANALAAVNEDASDENIAALQAYQDMMVQGGDESMRLMYDNQAAARINGNITGNAYAAQHLIRSHTKSIKPDNRDYFTFLGELSNPDHSAAIDTSQFIQDNNGHYSHADFIQRSLGGYDRSTIGKMQEGSLDRIFEQAQRNNLNAETKTKFEELTRAALTNSNIHIQDKIVKKINKIRSAMGYQEIQPIGNQNNNDSGTISLRENGSSGNGSVLRTGNDDRSLPPSVRGEAEDYRRSNEHSGIILPPDVDS